MRILTEALTVATPTVLTLVLTAVAGTPSPVVGQETSPEAVGKPTDSLSRETARPRDPAALARALTERYPVRLEERGIGGIVRIRAHVDAHGQADSVYVTFSSGVSRLDQIATSVVRSAWFHPAQDSTGPVGSWADLSMQFPVDAERDEGELVRPADRAAMEERVQPYSPPDLRRGGIEVPVVVILFVAKDGSVTDATVPTSECFPSAMSAALAAARELRFEPAGEDVVGPRTSIATFNFNFDGIRLRVLGDSDGPPTAGEAAEEPASAAVPRSRPRLRNSRTVQDEMGRRYPAHMRRMGLGGTVRVWAFVDERGRVTRRRLAETSGNCELDRAALDVARVMRFTPATRDGRAVAVWVALPVTFGTSDR
jgi:TonB family protein